MTKYERTLEAKIAARNRLHREALKWLPFVKQAAQAWIGKPIQNTGGDLKSKFVSAIGELPNTVPLLIILQSSPYTLHLRIKICEPVKGECFVTYAEDSYNVGDIQDQVLVKLSDPYPLRTDYTAKEVYAARVNLAKAEAVLSDARSAHGIMYFGTHDN